MNFKINISAATLTLSLITSNILSMDLETYKDTKLDPSSSELMGMLVYQERPMCDIPLASTKMSQEEAVREDEVARKQKPVRSSAVLPPLYVQHGDVKYPIFQENISIGSVGNRGLKDQLMLKGNVLFIPDLNGKLVNFTIACFGEHQFATNISFLSKNTELNGDIKSKSSTIENIFDEKIENQKLEKSFIFTLGNDLKNESPKNEEDKNNEFFLITDSTDDVYPGVRYQFHTKIGKIAANYISGNAVEGIGNILGYHYNSTMTDLSIQEKQKELKTTAGRLASYALGVDSVKSFGKILGYEYE